MAGGQTAAQPRDLGEPGRALRVLLLAAFGAAALAHVLVTLQAGFTDEVPIIRNVHHFVSHRTIVPPHTCYPTLYSYMIAPFTGLMVGALVAQGAPPTVADFQHLAYYDPAIAFWAARVTTATCLGLAVWLVYRSAVLAVGGRTGALLAALALASAPGLLSYSGYALPDVPMMMFCAAALLFSLQLAEGDRPRRAAPLAGVMIGLAAATKYSAVGMALPLAVAAWVGVPSLKDRLRAVGLAAASAAGAFIVGCPGWILAPRHYWTGFRYEAEHMSAGGTGFDGVPVLGQIELLTRADPHLMAIALIAGVLALIARRHRATLAVLIAAVAGTMLIAAPAKKQALQYLFAMYPALCLLLAWGLAALSHRRRASAVVGCAVVLLGAGLVSAHDGVRGALLPRSTEVAREWINVHTGPSDVLALDWGYVPRLLHAEDLAERQSETASDYVRELYAGLVPHPTIRLGYEPEFLTTTDAGYIITSSACYERFFEFGVFTSIRPGPCAATAPAFNRYREFYEALFSGLGGWEKVHEVETGNGPRVLIFTRSAAHPR